MEGDKVDSITIKKNSPRRVIMRDTQKYNSIDLTLGLFLFEDFYEPENMR